MTAPVTEIPAADQLAAVAAAHRLTMEATFVPYSVAKASRPDWEASDPTGEPWRGLTWKVRILKAGREVIATDYSAGIASAPGYKQTAWGSRKNWTQEQRDGANRSESLVAWEIENGKAGRIQGGARPSAGVYPVIPKRKPSHVGDGATVEILPVFADVLACLALDASVLDSGGFEEWASEYGCDTDSRKAEATYRACLEVALKLRAALGEGGLQALREAAADY